MCVCIYIYDLCPGEEESLLRRESIDWRGLLQLALVGLVGHLVGERAVGQLQTCG